MKKTCVLWLSLLTALLIGCSLPPTSGRKHTHSGKTPQEKGAGQHEPTGNSLHQHPWWETPPAEYASAQSSRWDDAAAIARGAQLYQTYCLMCHGADGKGQGPAAKNLPHARLTSPPLPPGAW